MLTELTRAYVDAINAGGVPTISSAWDSVVKIEGAKALEAAVNLYNKLLNSHSISYHFISITYSMNDFFFLLFYFYTFFQN